MKDEYKTPIAFLLAFLIALAGFAAADQLLFEGETTPDALKALSGWLVCTGAAVYAASLFWKQNKP